MSEAEKRQARQRAVSIAAVAAAFTVGGPLVGYRFDAQQIEETYRLDAASLNEAIKRSVGLEADARLTSGKGAMLVNVAYDPQSLITESKDDAFHGIFAAGVTTGEFGKARAEQTELDCLAEAVYYEARSESVLGQRAVAEVIMNRVRHPHYPKTICGVVYQGQLNATTGCQFTFTCDGSLNNRPRGAAWQEARDVALHTMMRLSPPVTKKATHYHTNYVNPYWSAGLIETRTIGTHIFYRMPVTRAEWTAAEASLAVERANREAFQPETDELPLTEASIEGVDAEAPAVIAATETAQGETAPAATAAIPTAAAATLSTISVASLR